MPTTMRSFLPTHPLINAARCCANPDCDKKEAEAAVIFIQRWMRNIIAKSLGRLPNRQAGAEAEAERSILLDIICPGCRILHYCTVDCQETHSKNHKLQCNQDAEELKVMKEWLKHNHNKENTDNDDDNNHELFQPIPPKDDCIICILPLPIDIRESRYLVCCGKSICNSCSEEHCRVTIERGQIPRCPFCRALPPLTDDENVIRLEKRMELNDSNAIYIIAQYYRKGECGLPQDPKKALDLYLRAAELGHSDACTNLAAFYEDGVVVTKDMTKARTYYEMAANKGDIKARHNLGAIEWSNGNYHTCGRHYLISAAAGHAKSLTKIARCYQYQLITKEEYSTALTSYNNVHKNEHSIERERAAAVPR